MAKTTPPFKRIFITIGLLLALSACGSPAVNSAGIRSTAIVLPAQPLATSTFRVPDTVPPPTATVPLAATATATPAELKNEALQKQVDQLAARFLGQGTNSGLAIAIVERDPGTGQLESIMLEYGKTSKVDGQPVTPDTVFEIGSITKVFTGILLAQQVDSGSVQLGDSIQNYLPEGIEAPEYNDIPISVEDLATHRSGLPRDIGTDSVPDMYGWLNGYHLDRAPGAAYSYSNLGYALLGDILARLTGTDFNTLEYQSVSQPLGLSDTDVSLNADQTSRLAQGYAYDGSPAQSMPESGASSSAGYMRSTIRDMLHFLIDNMQADSTPLSDSIKEAQVLQAEGPEAGTGVGLGWEIDQPGTANERLYKGGRTYGFTSYISFMRDGSSGFVLLANGMYGDTLAPRILGIVKSTR